MATGDDPPAWDLSDLYAGMDDAQIEGDLTEAAVAAQALVVDLRGRLGLLDPDALADGLDRWERVEELCEKVSSYAELLLSCGLEDEARRRFHADIRARVAAVRRSLIFIRAEWAAIDSRTADRSFRSARLRARRRCLDAVRSRAPPLSAREVEIIEALRETGGAGHAALRDEIVASLRFTIEGAGEVGAFTLDDVLVRLEDGDRRRREQAGLSLGRGLESASAVLVRLYNLVLADRAAVDWLCGRRHPADARDAENGLTRACVERLLVACEGRYDLSHRIHALWARALGLKALAAHDRLAPLPGETRRYSFTDARALIVGAIFSVSPTLGALTERFFACRWIDAAPGPGRRDGAYTSATVPSVHPYVFASFRGRWSDVLTLAHELGHGVHLELAKRHGLFDQHMPPATAEIASVIFERVVLEAMLAAADPAERKVFELERLAAVSRTLFRPVATTRFEERAHMARRLRGELSAATLGEYWLEEQRRAAGASLILDAAYASWWLAVPHVFHDPFYCYSYSAAELVALAVYKRTASRGELEPVLERLLSLGGSLEPRELLRCVDLDLDGAEIWTEGLRAVESLVERAEAASTMC